MTAPLGSPLVESRTIGRLRVHAIQAGGQKLDGGAMFGVVPKPLWERRIPPDEKNRIQLGMRCLLVEHDQGLVLIDTGAGNKEDDKFYQIYGVENRSNGATQLEEGLRALGHIPDDITLVINSHLHFDHAGGNTRRDEIGRIVPTFPKALYVVQRGEYEYAMRPNERTAASYFPHNFVPLQESGRFEFIDGAKEIVPGISGIPTPGHTPHHQGIRIESDGEVAFFIADLAPTSAHLPLPWIMGYDVEPLVTLETKRRILTQAVDEGWLIVFEHDAKTAWGKVAHDRKSFVLVP